MNTHFDDLLHLAQTDHNILGFILGGSRGKGFEEENSDYDVRMIVKDEVSDSYEQQYDRSADEGVDVVVCSYSSFKDYAVWGGPDAWDRYDFAHVKVLIDKTGDIASIAAQKSTVPQAAQKVFIERSLDAYINSVFRSVKCLNRNNESGALLEASSGIPHLLDALFAVNGRVKPFLGYLEKELKNYPLEKMPLSSESLLSVTLEILRTTDRVAQQKLYKAVSDFFTSEGFSYVFEGWEGKDRLIFV